MLESGFSSNCASDLIDGSMCSLVKSGKGSYLIVQYGILEEFGESSKVFSRV